MLLRWFWIEVRNDGSVPMHKLFLEMLEVNANASNNHVSNPTNGKIMQWSPSWNCSFYTVKLKEQPKTTHILIFHSPINRERAPLLCNVITITIIKLKSLTITLLMLLLRIGVCQTITIIQVRCLHVILETITSPFKYPRSEILHHWGIFTKCRWYCSAWII